MSFSLRFTPIISDISLTSNSGLSLGTTGIPVISRQSPRVLLELIQLDFHIKTIVAELVCVFVDLFNLAFHAFVAFFYVTPLCVLNTKKNALVSLLAQRIENAQ